MGSNPVAVTSPSDIAPASSKEFLDIQATIECGFTLKRVRDMIKTYSQKTFSGFFISSLKCALNLENFEKKDDYSSRGISKVIDSERGSYLNV